MISNFSSPSVSAGFSIALTCLGAAMLLLAATLPASAQSQAAADMFEKRCYSCHNIGGGDKKGPDLKGVTGRQRTAWLHEFIKSPAALNRKGDPAAADLFKKFAPEVMSDQDMTDEEITTLLTFIEDLSKKNEQFIPAGAKLSRPIAAGDSEAGLRLFTGKTALSGGGASCMACHNISGAGLLGGGTLGPDLTAANVKYRDPELISILQNPNFPTMNSVFATHPLNDEEIVQLFALFQNAKLANPAVPAPTAGPSIEPRFLLIGFAATVMAIACLNLLWRKRLRGVRLLIVRRRRQ
ncbi:MAG: cytochrome c [Blastocatellia bacterium]|nr:cytochrome c [Blastocatellia bacterium]